MRRAARADANQAGDFDHGHCPDHPDGERIVCDESFDYGRIRSREVVCGSCSGAKFIISRKTFGGTL